MIQQLGAANRQLQMELAGGKKEMQKLNAELVTSRYAAAAESCDRLYSYGAGVLERTWFVNEDVLLVTKGH